MVHVIDLLNILKNLPSAHVSNNDLSYQHVSQLTIFISIVTIFMTHHPKLAIMTQLHSAVVPFTLRSLDH